MTALFSFTSATTWPFGLVWVLDKVQEQMPEFLEVNAQLQQLQLQQASTSTTTATDTTATNDDATDPDMQEDQ